MPRVRRALLFMPGDDRHKIAKGTGLNVDSLIMDLEDGVALNRKREGRETIAAALRELDFGRSEKLVRINPGSTDLYGDDIRATVEARPDGYMLPKVETGDEVKSVCTLLDEAEVRLGLAPNSLPLIAIIETALGIINLREIASAHPRVAALAFGADDFSSSIGSTRTPEGIESFYARSAILTTAKAFDLQAIDTPYTDLHHLDGLTAETEMVMRLGFTGKLAIHPRQVEPIQAAFTPSAEEIDKAQRLIAAHDEHQAAGTGAFAYEGRMVDMPVVRRAENVLERARLAGILP
jgi:citrate lyase beta subunit